MDNHLRMRVVVNCLQGILWNDFYQLEFLLTEETLVKASGYLSFHIYKSLSICVCVCVCDPQTVLLYHNSSVRVDMQDASSWDWKLPNFTLGLVIYHSGNMHQLGNYNTYERERESKLHFLGYSMTYGQFVKVFHLCTHEQSQN